MDARIKSGHDDNISIIATWPGPPDRLRRPEDKPRPGHPRVPAAATLDAIGGAKDAQTLRIGHALISAPLSDRLGQKPVSPLLILLRQFLAFR